MNAKITQGKRQLWQWDTGVQLMLFDIGTANEVHFATPDGVIRRDIVNNMCNIPDVVLQRAGTMICYVFNREPYEGDTRHEFHFDVLPRPKPADYIDPPGEADYLDQLYDRLKDEIVGPPGPQGEQGQRGTGYLRILSKPADKVEMVDGKVVAHNLSLNLVKAEANVDEVRIGDCLLYNGAYVYPVVAVDVNVYTSKVIDLHGPEGPQGVEGERGEAGPAGPQGPTGAPGSSGVYIGKEAPTDANVWIDPEGKGTETLPNPHPLVINGVSYDGSERMEVDVPAEGQILLYDRICVGYRLLTEKPADWETNHSRYYWISEQGVIAPCDYARWHDDKRSLYAAWEYVGEPNTVQIQRTVDMYGQEYDFTNVTLLAHIWQDEKTGLLDWNFTNGEGFNSKFDVAAGIISIPAGANASYPYHMAARVERKNGAYSSLSFGGARGAPSTAYGPANSWEVGHTSPAVGNIKGMYLFVYQNKTIPEGSYFEVWGVRA